MAELRVTDPATGDVVGTVPCGDAASLVATVRDAIPAGSGRRPAASWWWRGRKASTSALMLRLHPSPSRVARLRDEMPAAFVAFDLLARDDEDLRARPFRERRPALESVLAGRSGPPVW